MSVATPPEQRSPKLNHVNNNTPDHEVKIKPEVSSVMPFINLFFISFKKP